MLLKQETITEFLEEKMGIAQSDIDADTELFSSGILDSFSMIELVLFIEKTAGIKLDPTDVRLDNLDSIERILYFVSQKNEVKP